MYSNALASIINFCTLGQKNGIVWYHPHYFNTEDLETWDKTFYIMMIKDKKRMNAYRNAIKKAAKGKIVLEIGTGAYYPLAKMCVEAGAKKVYAIEGNKKAFQMLKEGIKKDGIDNKMEILEGFSTNIKTLPQKAELLVHELIGSVGSDEGMGAFVADAKKRFLADNASFIPFSCKTVISPIMWPGNSSLYNIVFNALRFIKKPWNPFNKNFNLMHNIYMVWNLPETCLLNAPLEFERIDFNENYPLEENKRLSFKIEKKSLFNGLYLWSIITVDKENIIDCYRETTWPCVYLELSKKGVELTEGDELILETYRNITKNPFYQVKAYFNRGNTKIDIGEFKLG